LHCNSFKMLRKVTHITLVFLLLATTMGVTFYKHYCGQNLESVSINSLPTSCCDGPCNCCHNESFSVKIHDDFSVTAFTFDFHQVELAVPVICQLFIADLPVQPKMVEPKYDLPPPPIQTILSSLQTYRL
jgi:hypothetical protein